MKAAIASTPIGMTSLRTSIFRFVSYFQAYLRELRVPIGCYHAGAAPRWGRTGIRASSVLLVVAGMLTSCSSSRQEIRVDSDVAIYLDQVGQLKDDDIGVATLLRQDMENANRAVTLRNMQSAGVELADVVYTMRELTPPSDLVRFHVLMLDTWTTHKHYVDASNQYLSSGGGLDEVNRLYGSYVLHRREAFSEMNRYAQANGLPDRYVDPVQG